ncbi:MAG: polysaccharide pyruvyl transferase family protein [Pseudomonadota bacterium]
MSLIKVVSEVVQSYQAKPWPLVKPRVIQFPVNDICNARCQMCKIWEQKLDKQISPEQLESALSNDLFSDVTSVGVNGGEPTLRKDLSELVDVLYRTLPRLNTISLITNALVSKRVIAAVEALAEVVKRHDGHLDVMVSLDGVGEIHDTVRGREGNFKNAEKVLDFLSAGEGAWTYQLACTVVRDNVPGLFDLLDYAISRDTYIKYRLGVPHRRLYADEVSAPFALNEQEKYDLCVFLETLISSYEQSEPQRFFYRSLIDQIMYDAPRKAGCNWQHRGVTISARGELLYCAVQSNTLGSLAERDADALYYGHQDHLQDIIRTKCDGCTHDYGGIPAEGEYARQCLVEAASRIGLPLREFERGERLVPVSQWLRGIKLGRKESRYGIRSPDPIPAPMKALPKSPQIMICGWYGTETLGDKAILGGIVRALNEQFSDYQLHLVSLETYISRMTQRQMPELAGATIVPLEKAVKQTAEMDVVLFGGGPLMAVNAILDMLAIFRAAASLGKPTVVAGCGVGPMGGDIHNTYIQRLLQLSSVRLFRDQLSMDNAASLGVDVSRDTVTEDPAHFWLRSCSTPTTNLARGGRRLLLALRDWPHQQYSKHKPERAQIIQSQFEAAVMSCLTRLVGAVPDLQIIPFPMCTNHHGGDDRWYYRRLFAGHPEAYEQLDPVLDKRYLSGELSPQEASDVFASADVLLGMRFHSLVFAAERGVPAVAVDYTEGRGKVAQLARRLKLPIFQLDEIGTSSFEQSLLACFAQDATALAQGEINGDFACDLRAAMQC